jgi:hypothetical protein
MWGKVSEKLGLDFQSAGSILLSDWTIDEEFEAYLLLVLVDRDSTQLM